LTTFVVKSIIGWQFINASSCGKLLTTPAYPEEDLVLETMDAIVGWCNESTKLFPSYDWTQNQANGDASTP
jgi:hypothetical protein